MQDLRNIGEVLSLGMTFPTIILALAVVYVWAPSVKRPKEANEWFILGVVSGFLGAIVDNFYWFLPWTASFLDLELKEFLFVNGVYVNIFFRQGLGILAAYSHLKAAELHSEKSFKYVNLLLIFSSLLGVLYSSFILCLKIGM